MRFVSIVAAAASFLALAGCSKNSVPTEAVEQRAMLFLNAGLMADKKPKRCTKVTLTQGEQNSWSGTATYSDGSSEPVTAQVDESGDSLSVSTSTTY